MVNSFGELDLDQTSARKGGENGDLDDIFDNDSRIGQKPTVFSVQVSLLFMESPRRANQSNRFQVDEH